MQAIALTLLTLMLLALAVHPLATARRGKHTPMRVAEVPPARIALVLSGAACVGCALALAAPSWAKALGGDAGGRLFFLGLGVGAVVSAWRWAHDLAAQRSTGATSAAGGVGTSADAAKTTASDASAAPKTISPSPPATTSTETPAVSDHKIQAVLRQPLVRATKVLASVLVVVLSIHLLAPVIASALAVDRSVGSRALDLDPKTTEPALDSYTSLAHDPVRAMSFALCIALALAIWLAARRRAAGSEQTSGTRPKLWLAMHTLCWAVPSAAMLLWSLGKLDRIFLGAAGNLLDHGILESPNAAQLFGLLLGVMVGSSHALVRTALEGPRGTPLPLPTSAWRLAALASPLIVALASSTMENETLTVAQRSVIETANGEPRWILLQPAQRRALMADPRTGQRIVLPENTSFEVGNKYRVRFHADPRGVKIGTVLAEKNVLLVPAWEAAQNIDHLWFRAREPEQANIPGYDFEVPVTSRALFAQGDTVPTAFELRPVDPEIELAKLARRFDGPYTPLNDLELEASVLDAFHGTFGLHRFMFELRPQYAPLNPVLREIVGGLRYAGPFPVEDDEEIAANAPSGRSRLPLAMVAVNDANLSDGERVRLKMSPPARGVTIGELRAIQGELRVPAWDVLAAARFGVLRHRTDPTRDIRFPVLHRLAADGTLRFRSAIPELVALERFEAMTDYESIGLLPAPAVFEAYVQRTARGLATDQPRLTLIPDLALGEPVRGRGGGIYRPHPIELMSAGFSAPQRDLKGSALAAEVLLSSLRSAEPAAWPPALSRAVSWIFALLAALALIHILAQCGVVLAVDLPESKLASSASTVSAWEPLELGIVVVGLGWTSLLILASSTAMPADPLWLSRAIILIAALAMASALLRRWLVANAAAR